MDLAEKSRPKSFKEVIGHEAHIKALKASLDKGAHTFVFIGPSGVGKTTLARIAAAEVGCLPQDRLEVDAASYTGIDDMRNVAATLQYRPLGNGSVKAIIVDEFHALSAKAMQSLLKILEEPPSWAYWFLCTTEPIKLPTTIRTRCLRIELKPLPSKVLYDELLGPIADKENFACGDDVLWLCAKEAGGSPRQAISNLSLCGAAASIEEARELLRTAEGTVEAYDLAKLLWRRGVRWMEVRDVLDKLKDSNAESVRHVCRAYFTTCALGAKDEPSAGRALELLDVFSQPFHPADSISPLVLACGKAVFPQK